MKNLQKGFTLIELMIVVAIIGILAAIAIPQYQDYITRAKWQDNLARVQTFKTAIAECLQNNAGSMAECDDTTKVASSTGAQTLPTVSATATPNISALSYSATGILITGTNGVGSGGASCTVLITADNSSGSSVAWRYTNGGAAGCNKSKTGVGT